MDGIDGPEMSLEFLIDCVLTCRKLADLQSHSDLYTFPARQAVQAYQVRGAPPPQLNLNLGSQGRGQTCCFMHLE
jgi:hypothetical protein